jgi:hypothetical protein
MCFRKWQVQAKAPGVRDSVKFTAILSGIEAGGVTASGSQYCASLSGADDVLRELGVVTNASRCCLRPSLSSEPSTKR